MNGGGTREAGKGDTGKEGKSCGEGREEVQQGGGNANGEHARMKGSRFYEEGGFTREEWKLKKSWAGGINKGKKVDPRKEDKPLAFSRKLGVREKILSSSHKGLLHRLGGLPGSP